MNQVVQENLLKQVLTPFLLLLLVYSPHQGKRTGGEGKSGRARRMFAVAGQGIVGNMEDLLFPLLAPVAKEFLWHAVGNPAKCFFHYIQRFSWIVH